jgi:hypothetical protein
MAPKTKTDEIHLHRMCKMYNMTNNCASLIFVYFLLTYNYISQSKDLLIIPGALEKPTPENQAKMGYLETGKA